MSRTGSVSYSALTIFDHADREALLVPTKGAVSSSFLINLTDFAAKTHILGVFLHRSLDLVSFGGFKAVYLEEALAALAGQDAIVLPAGLVAAHGADALAKAAIVGIV